MLKTLKSLFLADAPLSINIQLSQPVFYTGEFVLPPPKDWYLLV